MKLDVFFTPGELTPADLVDRTAVVIDILRASSTVVTALGEGAKSIYPVASIEEALRLANTFGRDEVLLCGERKCLPIDGFDMGNSPREFTAERVKGKTLVMSTTNGTSVMALTTGASRVYIGSLLNLSALVKELASSEVAPVLVCSGREKQFALEDATFAGLLAQRLMEERPGDWQLNDGAHAAVVLAREFGTGKKMFDLTGAGAGIVEAGLADDLAFCARQDVYDVLPVLHERTITLAQAAVSTSS